MFSRSWSAALALSAALLFLAGCSRQPKNRVERLLIPSFENLSADGSLDWMSYAFSEVVAAEISNSPRIQPIVAGISADPSLAGATQVLHGYFSVIDGRLRVNAALEQVEHSRTLKTFALEGPLGAGVLPLADRISRSIEPQAQPFSTKNPEALKAFAEARATDDADTAAAALRRALVADPDFGLAYAYLSRLLLSRGEHAAAEQVIQMAKARGGRISEIDRARLDLEAATLENSDAARVNALSKLAPLMPSNLNMLRTLGQLETKAHHFNLAVEWYQKAVGLDPSNPLLWNDLGYAKAFARDFDGARSALRKYQELAPGDANPLDSLGDVHFYFGAFTDAQKYYLQAHQKNASFLGGAALYKAARARLMTGDTNEADQVFHKYADIRRAAKDPLIEYREAQWKYLIGRRREAIAQMTRFSKDSSGQPDMVSQAYSQLSAWNLESGDRDSARESAVRAAESARSLASRNLASICQILATSAESPSDLSAKAHRAFPNPSEQYLRNLAVGYGLLLDGQFQNASQVLEELFKEADPSAPEQINVLLAWTLVETGRFEDAAHLLQTYGIPQPGAESPFAFLTFPRIFLLKSKVLENQGRKQEAKRNLELFQKLSGGPGGQRQTSTSSVEPVVLVQVAGSPQRLIVEAGYSEQIK